MRLLSLFKLWIYQNINGNVEFFYLIQVAIKITITKVFEKWLLNYKKTKNFGN